MKLKILKLYIVPLLFLLIGASCEKDDEYDQLFELQVGEKEATIQEEVDGIEFKFCLLNEKGEPTTVFEEGENFTFYFSIKNNTDKHLLFHDYGFYEDKNFFSVKSKTQNFGRPFDLIRTSMTLEMRYILIDKESIFFCDWQDEREEFRSMHGIFKGKNNPALKKGIYSTEFAYAFVFGNLKTDKLAFKINFEIK